VPDEKTVALRLSQLEAIRIQSPDFVPAPAGPDANYSTDEHLLVNAQGEALVFYNGVKDPDMRIENGKVIFTPKFRVFDTTGRIEPGAWFSPDPKVAQCYGTPVPFHLKAKSPLRFEGPLTHPPIGHDAVYRMRGKGDSLEKAWEIAVFSPDQIVAVNLPLEHEVSVELLLEGTEVIFDDYGHGWFRHRGDDRAVDLEIRGDAFHVKLLEERADTSVFEKSLYDVATASFCRESGTAEMMKRLKLFIATPIRALVGPVAETEVKKPVDASPNGRGQSFDIR